MNCHKIQNSIFAILSLLICSHSIAASTIDKAIFGQDDRKELYSVSLNWKEIGHSIAGKVSLDHLKNYNSYWTLEGKPLSKKECPAGRFSDQITVPSCTGFLVKPNVLVTAAHCIKSIEDCTNYNWVFEYSLANSSDKSYTKVENNRVYKCKNIVSRVLKNFGDVDYAIIELDRNVENRKPLSLGLDYQYTAGIGLVNIGNSNGLPLKFKDAATIQNIKPTGLAFESDLDTFSGDSGSPVFDAATGLVIGITSNGNSDHVHEGDSVCRKLKICNLGDNCYLSTSSNISNLKDEAILK